MVTICQNIILIILINLDTNKSYKQEIAKKKLDCKCNQNIMVILTVTGAITS